MKARQKRLLFVALGIAGMVFDCIFTARRMARQEDQAEGRARR